MDSKVVRADFGSGLICPRAQTCMDSKVVRADFGSGLIRPRTQTCCASPTRTPARLANSPGFKSFRCPRWRIKFSLERFSDPLRIRLRIQPLTNSASSLAYRLQTAALENQQNSPDLLELDYCSTHNEQWSVLALSNSRE